MSALATTNPLRFFGEERRLALAAPSRQVEPDEGFKTRTAGEVRPPTGILVPPFGASTRRLPKEPRAVFEEYYAQAPKQALGDLLLDVSLGVRDAPEAVAWLFPLLVTAPSKRLNLVFLALQALRAPQEILDTALAEYDHSGRERCLSLAVSLLEDLGAGAWPALRKLARSTRPECELFVGAIAHCPGVALKDRVAALRDLASHPDAAVRDRVYHSLSDFPAEVSRSLLHVFATDADAAIRQAARQRLEGLPL